MPSLLFTTSLLGWVSLAVAIAIPVPQSTDIDYSADVDYYCNNYGKFWDRGNANDMFNLWTNNTGRRSIGTQMAGFAQNVVGSGESNHRWADNMMNLAKPNAGDNGLVDCGKPHGECDPNIECENFASRGYGYLFWSLRALVGMHSKISIASDYLDKTVISTMLSLDEIANDFTAPPRTDDLDGLAAMLGTVLYFMGGAAGMAGVAATTGASRAAAQSARAGVLKAQRTATYQKYVGQTVKQKEELAKIDKAIENAQKIAASSQTTASLSAPAGVFGASTYFIGGSFNTIGLGVDPKDNSGEITGSDLKASLEALFTQTDAYLRTIGRLAAGHREEGDPEYSMLPGQRGASDYWEDNDIAFFYSDGAMLYGGTSEFNNSIKDAYATFKPRIVDIALQKSLFTVIAQTNFDDQTHCEGSAFGTRWIDDTCVNLFQEFPDTTSCGEDTRNKCQFIPMSETQHKALTDKYGFDIYDYMKAQMDCAKSGGKPGEPDFLLMPADGSSPACWYSVPAKKGKLAVSSIGGSGELSSATIKLEEEAW